MAGVLGPLGCAAATWQPGEEPFQAPLPVPPLEEGIVDAGGRRVFHLEVMDGQREFRPGTLTPTRGVNGGHLGPTLRARRGEKVLVHLYNRLDEATTMHWHGMELPPAMDGGPHQAVPPGGSWSPEWTIDQPAATLWYHPHPHGRTEAQVQNGIAGFFLLDDAESEALALPSDYGVDDIPILIQDLTVGRNGSLVRDAPWYNQVGPLGREVRVNGALRPHLHAPRERMRLRLLNASVARVYNLGFEDGRSFQVVAGDGGLLAAPHRADRIQLSPGERAEIVVRVQPGERAVLSSFRQELGTDFVNHRLAGGNDRFRLIEVRAAPALEPSPPLPDRLGRGEPPDPSAAVRTRRFEVSSRAINGQAMDMGRIDLEVEAGSTEIWEVEGIAVPHNVHIHGLRFRLLDVDGEPPDPAFAGWKDTAYLLPDRVTRLLVSIPALGTGNAPFLIHCHFLRHEDDGAMAQFRVVPRGAG